MRPGDIVEIIYLAKDGTFSQRHIRIIEVGETYIKAYCYKRKQTRVFSREGILAYRRVKSA